MIRFHEYGVAWFCLRVCIEGILWACRIYTSGSKLWSSA